MQTFLININNNSPNLSEVQTNRNRIRSMVICVGIQSWPVILLNRNGKNRKRGKHVWTYFFTFLLFMTITSECSLLYKSKGKDHILSTSQKAGLTGLYKKFLFIPTTAISKPIFQEVDGTPLTFRKEWAFPAITKYMNQYVGGPLWPHVELQLTDARFLCKLWLQLRYIVCDR